MKAGWMFTALGVLFGLALGGCSAMNPLSWWGEPSEQAPQRLAGTTRYQCSGGKELAVRQLGQSVMVVLPEREFRLDAAAGATGRYTNGRATLDIRGAEAELQENGAALFAACKRAA